MKLDDPSQKCGRSTPTAVPRRRPDGVGSAHSWRRSERNTPEGARWAVLLNTEVRLIAKPSAHIIAIGRDVFSFLERNGLGRDVKSIMHYSALANAARNAAVMEREDEFLAFSETLSMQEIVDVAAEVMQENSISVAMIAETITRLRKATLSESRKKLAFIYSTVFAELSARGRAQG